MNWDKPTKEKFDQMIEKVPVFMRSIAEDKVGKKAESLSQKAGKDEIDEKIMIDAFFEATPFGFHGPMKNDMESLGIDYTKYGYEK